jgi:hypothetical protein
MKNLIILFIITYLSSCTGGAQDCKSYFYRSAKIYDKYLFSRDISTLDSALFLVNQSLDCNPKGLNGYLLKAKILFAVEEYDSALSALRTLEKYRYDPSISSLKGYVFEKLNMKDSSNFYFEKSLTEYEALLVKDSSNYSHFLAKLQLLYKLRGQKVVFEEIDNSAKNFTANGQSEAEIKRTLRETFRKEQY